MVGDNMLETYAMLAGIVFILLILSAAISSSETALTGASKARLISMVNSGHVAAARVWALLEQPKKFIGAILLTNNLVNIAASSIITTFFVTLYGESGAIYATFFMTILVVIFGELIPKTIAITKPTETAIFLSLFVKFIVKIFFPFVAVLQFIVDIFFKIIGFKSKGIVDEDIVREELRGTIDMSHQHGGVFKDERDRLGGLLDLRDLDVSEVMIHRKDIVMMDIDTPTAELITNMLATPYTRVPIYRDDTENIIGVLHAKDVLRALSQNNSAMESVDIAEIMRKPWYIPDTTAVTDQLNKFLSRRNHFAIVVDEYGAVQGLITLEDILEEIVGDIRDEHDQEIPGLRKQPDGSYIVDGKISVRDLNRKTDWRLPDEDYTTVAGLVMHESRTIPEKGQSFVFFGVRFEIMDRERNQIKKLRVSLLPKEISLS